MSQHNTLDPAKYVASFNGVRITGFAKGTMINVERDEAAFAKTPGATGDTVRVRNRNRGGKATFTLMAESPVNDQLSALAQLDEKFGTGSGELLITDLNGTSVYEAENAWIEKISNAPMGDEAQNREWVIDCAELLMFVGGNETP